MSIKKQIIILSLLSSLIFQGVFVPKAQAYQLSAVSIYQQAVRKNHNFFRQLARYRGAIDVQNRLGDTAYCLAMVYQDRASQSFLMRYGANPNHRCAQRRRAEMRSKKEFLASSYNKRQYSTQRAETVQMAQSGNNYLWWGLGALAVGGGVAAIASSSGGGSHHISYVGPDSGNTGGNDNPGGNTGGNDNPGGNTGGNDNPGGNTGGNDNPGGNTGGNDNPGGNTGGNDNPGGNTGGNDNPGGNTGGNDNPGGNTGGNDNPGGNTGGNDNPGGNTGGNDNPGGNTGGNDNPGGNTGGNDNPGGNTGGNDNPGGNTGGNDNPGGNTGGSEDTLTNVSATSFKTAEYTKSGFLDKINAASAYSTIYQQNSKGELVSHQAASNKPLETVTVGVIDTGVMAHEDLNGKIVGNYDGNAHNSLSNIWGYANGNTHYYVYKNNNAYYLLQIDVTSNSYKKFADLDRNSLDSTLTSRYGLTLNDFSLLNGSGGGAPGITTEGFDASSVNSWWDMFSELSHGTHVAGIIAGNKNDTGSHGIAFENAKIYSGSWDYEQNLLPMVQSMVDNGKVSVVNNSWAMDINRASAANPNWLYSHNSVKVLNAYAYAAKNKAVWVQSTGNDGANEAAVHAGMGSLDLSGYGYNGPRRYEVPFIAVTSLGSNGTIANYANWCGSAKNYCIAAPGDNVVSTSAVPGGYMPMSGTSMAAPVVSGSIALLKGYYPYLSAQNIAWLLLETADNTGAYSDSSIYGRGALDLDAAMNTPMGSLSVPTSASLTSLTPVSGSKIVGSSVMNGSLAKAMPAKITVFDELKRPFEYDTSNMISKTHASNANFRNAVAHAGVFKQKKKITDEKTGFQFNTSESLKKDGQAHLSSVDVVSESETGSTRFYYAENSKYTTTESVLKPSDNPYFAMNEAYGAENTLNLSETSKLKLSLQTGENGLYGRDEEQDKYDFDARSYAVGAEYSFNLTDYLELATVGGLLYEEDAVLGLNGQGALAFQDGSTYYMGLKAKLNLTPNVALLAAYYRGYTEGQSSSLMAISGLETESFMLAGEYQLNAKDKVGLSLSSPLSVRRGHGTFNYASGRDNYSDTVYMQKLTRSLKPAAKEYDVGIYYLGEPKEDLNLMGKIEARFNADGEKGKTDYIGIVGVSHPF